MAYRYTRSDAIIQLSSLFKNFLISNYQRLLFVKLKSSVIILENDYNPL